ncbi:hypothetical protein C8F04DRAFT_996170 [Mycena alexandri]|uniref:Uncharacterized protein n=1 Tax=Mycena alexandri TaxID=1745969 RepID=A0AAD6T5U8_9AGAR|nr:hypothetical protein C8F04DRAFT_996170 [Mycena alexandri]
MSCVLIALPLYLCGRLKDACYSIFTPHQLGTMPARQLRETVQRRSTVSRSKRRRLESLSRSDSPTDNIGQGALTMTSLPVSITSRLAPELYDHFLDEFRASKSSLSACSSVCRSWLARCRHHLFSTANLRPDFVRFLRDSPHAFATITPYIRNIGLGGGWLREQQHEFNDIILFMINLERVLEIHMETWSWTYLASPAATALLSGQGKIFQTLTVLDLKFIHFPSFSTLRTLGSQFPKLQELEFDNVTWDETDDADAIQPTPPPTFLPGLEKLSVYACSNEPIISWLSNAVAEDGIAVVAPIRFLYLPEVLPHEATLVGNFLSTLPSSLEGLELGFLAHNSDDTPAIQDVVGGMDLSFHTKLRTIRLHQLSLYQFPSTPPTPTSSPPLAEISPYVWLIPFLSRIGSSELSEIAFNIWLGGERQLDLIDWRALVKVLDNPRFTKLRLLQFNVRGIEEAMDEEVRGWISHRLRDWDAAKEFLKVSFE